jgi:hypothetical protein
MRMSKVLAWASLSLFLGIDISKEKFDACCIGSNGEKRFRISASMDREGFEGLLMQISSVAKPQESILIGMESTAITSICTHFLRPRDLLLLLSTPCSYPTS